MAENIRNLFQRHLETFCNYSGIKNPFQGCYGFSQPFLDTFFAALFAAFLDRKSTRLNSSH